MLHKTFVFNRIENIVGKGENADHQHFLLFPQCFQQTLFPQERQKSSLCGNFIDSVRETETILNLMKIAESSSKAEKTLWDE